MAANSTALAGNADSKRTPRRRVRWVLANTLLFASVVYLAELGARLTLGAGFPAGPQLVLGLSLMAAVLGLAVAADLRNRPAILRGEISGLEKNLCALGGFLAGIAVYFLIFRLVGIWLDLALLALSLAAVFVCVVMAWIDDERAGVPRSA